MQEMTGGVLAIFVGVISEQWAVEKRIDVLQRTELAGCPVTLGSVGRKPVLVCRTGLGIGAAVPPRRLASFTGQFLREWSLEP